MRRALDLLQCCSMHFEWFFWIFRNKGHLKLKDKSLLWYEVWAKASLGQEEHLHGLQVKAKPQWGSHKYGPSDIFQLLRMIRYSSSLQPSFRVSKVTKAMSSPSQPFCDSQMRNTSMLPSCHLNADWCRNQPSALKAADCARVEELPLLPFKFRENSAVQGN